MESCDKRLEQPHQQVEREVLPAVRMPRELQIVPGGACRECALRLMRQQHPHIARRRPRHRRRGIGSVSGEAAARKIRDARKDDPARPLADHLVPVDERIEAEPFQLAHPSGRIPVVLVIPRDEVFPVRRLEAGERCHVVAQRGRESVGYVPRQRDQIGLETVGGVHHALDEVPLERRADVQVGELRDSESLEIGWQPVDRDVDHAHHRGPTGSPQADQQHGNRGAHHDGARAAGAEPRAQVQQVARKREHDQQRRQTESGKAGNLETPFRRHPLGPSGEQRHERCDDQEQNAHPADQTPRGRERRLGEQTLPHIHVQHGPQTSHDDDHSNQPPAPTHRRVFRLSLHGHANAAHAGIVAPRAP